MIDRQKNISEHELVRLLRAKNPEGMAYLYDHYSSSLYGVAFQIVKRKEYAEEILQDAFIIIWNKIDSYDSQKSRLFTWMLNIVRNKSIDKIRSAEVRRADKSDATMNVVSIIDSNESYEQDTNAIGLQEILNDLNEEQRFVLEKVYFKGYTHSEIAKEFDIPLGTVKTRLRSALIALREKIGLK